MKFVLSRKLAAACILAGLLADGCSSNRNQRFMSEEALAPRPPAFLTGATAALFTNSAGISAQLSLERGTNRPLTGTLLAWGSHLLFAPKGDRTFMWDVSTHSGYVISESMQSYAPISSGTYVTGVVTRSETAGPLGTKINGEAGHLAEVMVSLNDGSNEGFAIWRATEWQGFPVQIRMATNGVTGTINLTGLRRGTFSAALFQPPAQFTAYPSLEAMTGEFMMRQSKVNTRATIEHPKEDISLPNQPSGGPSRY